MESGQKEIKSLLIELDPKNANRHLETNERLDNLIEENRFICEILGEHEVSIRTLRRRII
ncbi:hypothetical protein [Proteiniborus sp. MB09-C3]|uniref:hypothetical protein n=1 Tax=Proteiniborus sp. MB09-C3 TaxID=3050072 RepID=UPI0025562C03|nr:hypothetical protein [Proteiniborus sp. MB09-C3]WIV11137.1 hypothetical protein QO263_13390 [Proteiniborus sp. MB09-C3]